MACHPANIASLRVPDSRKPMAVIRLRPEQATPSYSFVGDELQSCCRDLSQTGPKTSMAGERSETPTSMGGKILSRSAIFSRRLQVPPQ
jgi:hypothetical protein